MNTALDSFETALLTQLREHIDQHNPEPTRASRRRRLILSAAALAAGVTTLGVLVPELGTEAAYSVQEGNTGTITVEVRRPENAAGLEAELAKYGINADITYLPYGQQCAPGRFTPVERSLPGMGIVTGSDLLELTLPPGAVQEGETVVMWISGEIIPAEPESTRDENGVRNMGGYTASGDFDVSAGPVSPCDVVPYTD